MINKNNIEGNNGNNNNNNRVIMVIILTTIDRTLKLKLIK